jgi:hypothetical protein
MVNQTLQHDSERSALADCLLIFAARGRDALLFGAIRIILHSQSTINILHPSSNPVVVERDWSFTHF